MLVKQPPCSDTFSAIAPHLHLCEICRLMLRPTGQSDKIQSIKSNQYIGSIGSIGYIGSIVHTGNIPPVKWIN